MGGIVPDNGTVTLKQIIEVIHKDDKKLLLSQRETGRETGKPYSYDFRIIKNGRIRHIHLSAEPIIINDELQGYAGIVQDITQRKIAQIRLEENKSFLDLILQGGIRAAIIIVDPVKRKIRFLNNAAEELLKQPAKELVNTGCHNFLCALNHSGSCEDEPTLHKHNDFLLTLKNGEQVSTMKTVIRVNWRGGAIHHAMIFFDMTDRKNLEIQLAHAQKMESIGHLAAGVAHELNTRYNT